MLQAFLKKKKTSTGAAAPLKVNASPHIWEMEIPGSLVSLPTASSQKPGDKYLLGEDTAAPLTSSHGSLEQLWHLHRASFVMDRLFLQLWSGTHILSTLHLHQPQPEQARGKREW